MNPNNHKYICPYGDSFSTDDEDEFRRHMEWHKKRNQLQKEFHEQQERQKEKEQQERRRREEERQKRSKGF